MSKINDIIQKMNNDKEYEIYFFRQAPNYQNLHLWIKPLYDNKYLNSINDLNFEYLEKVSLENREKETKETTELLIDIIDNAISNRTGEVWREDWYIIKVITNMPSNTIKLDYIQFIWDALKKDTTTGVLSSEIMNFVVHVLLENNMNEYLLKVIEILFDYRVDSYSKSYQEREPLVEKYWLNKLMSQHSKQIAKEVGIDGFIIILDIVKKITDQDKGAFNDVWIVTIEKHQQNSFPDSYDNQIISFARDLLEVIDPIDLKDIMKDLLYQEHPIFKRLAFHTINYHYDTLKEMFWQWFDSEENSLDSTYKHECYKLVKDRADKFTDDELQKVLVWIENLDYSRYYTGEELVKITAYRKKKWLLSIKEFSKEAKILYERYNEIAPQEIEHPGFTSWSSGFQLIDHSHIEDKEEFCKQSATEIVKYIQDFNPKKIEKSPFDTDTDLIEGLAEDLGNCIINNPPKFSEEISLFDDLDYMHKYYIVHGFGKAWQNKQKFDWENLFDFIDKTLDDTFYESQDRYKFWLIGEIANLIEYGTQEDDNSFDKILLPKAKIILFKLLENREDEVIDSDDWVNHVLNSSNGKVLHALISYALRYGRLNSNQKVKWEKKVKEFFTYQLEQNSDYSISVFTILGQYLSNLLFLDRDWVDTNFNKIFPIQNDKLWEVSIDGYFSFSRAIYKDIYTKFKDLGHLQKSIDFKFKQDRTSGKIIQHICTTYMVIFDNKTIFDIIESKNSNNILRIINIIWSRYRDKYREDNAKKIHILWYKIFDIFKGETNSEAQDIFSALCRWFVFIEVIDEDNIELLKLSVSYSQKQNNINFIAEELLRLANENSKYVGEIYIFMIKNNIYPTYKKEDIVDTISLLLKNENTKENAIKICNMYAKKGIYFLNSLLKS